MNNAISCTHEILFKNANYIKILSKNGNNVLSSTKSNELIVKIVPWGPNQAKVESITGNLLNRSSVKRYLKKSLQQQDLTKDRSLSAEGKTEKRKLRLLSFELIDDERIESNITTTSKKRKKTASTSPYTPPKFYRSIYYDYDKWDIRPDAAVELDKLAKVFIANPELTFELSSHTDSRGGDTYNLVLSDARANSAVDYLVRQGVSPDRLVARGYGETMPVNGCVNGVKCTEEEHQANRHTEFKVISRENAAELK